MRLTSFLQMPGGISEEGREVTFRLRYPGRDGAPLVKDVTGILLPLSEVEMQAAQEAAQGRGAAPIAGAPPPAPLLPEGQEYVIRLLAASLRDPGDRAKRLIEDENDLRSLRAGLVGSQYTVLLGEYKKLIEQEYPEVVSEKDAAALEKEARGFSASDQRAPG